MITTVETNFVTNPGVRSTAIWWAIVTTTTVGDVTANVTAHFVEEEQDRELAELRAQLDQFRPGTAARAPSR